MEFIKFILLGIALVNFTGCERHSNVIVKKILYNKYDLIIDLYEYDFHIDTSRVYIGNEELIYLSSNKLKVGLEIIIGFSNPNPSYFDVLDFSSKNQEYQFNRLKYKKFISNSEFKGYHGTIYSIYYIEDNELEKVESQFSLENGLVVNTRMTRNLDFVDKNVLTNMNSVILKSIRIELAGK